MTIKGDEITLPRLIMRRPLPPDEPHLAALWSDAEVTRFLPSGRPIPPDRAAAALKSFMGHWEEHAFGVWSLLDRESGEWIGYCGLRYLPDSPEVELLYAIGRKWWRTGLTTEAARAAVHFGFTRVNVPRIVALALPQNAGSIGVMKASGFHYQRDDHMFGLDVVSYSLTRDEYEAEQRAAAGQGGC